MPLRPIPIVLFALLFALALPSVAPAAPPSPTAPPALASDLAATPLPNGLNTDGPIYSLSRAGDTLYLGGDFSYLGEPMSGLTVLDAEGRIPAGAARSPEALEMMEGPNGGLLPDGAGGWFATIDPNRDFKNQAIVHVGPDMRPLPGWPVQTTGMVTDMVLEGNTLYVAGEFWEVAGQPRSQIAALDATSGELLSWAPAYPEPAYASAIAVSDNIVYVAYEWVEPPIVAYDRVTGEQLDWKPQLAAHIIRRMIVDGGRLYAAGQLAPLDQNGEPPIGSDITGLIVLDVATGAAVGPTFQYGAPKGFDAEVYDIALDAETIYLGGLFDSVDGQPRIGLAAIDRTSGELRPWRNDLTYNRPDNETHPTAFALYLSGDTLYVGGVFECIGGQARRNLAALHAGTGEVLPWQGNANRRIYHLAAANGLVAIGGEFTLAGGVVTSDVAAIDLTTGRPRPWATHYERTTNEYDFGWNDLSIVSTVSLGDALFAVALGWVDVTKLMVLRHDDATELSWDSITGALGSSLATGAGMIFMSQEEQESDIIVRAYDPFGTAPRWERTIPAVSMYRMVVAGDTLYGVAYGHNNQKDTGLVFALNIADGTPRWEQPVGGPLSTLAVDGGTLYIGGHFQQIGDTPVTNLAALDATSGAVLAWPAELAPDDRVTAMMIEGGRLYLGGHFLKIGPATREGLAAIDLSAGPSLLDWTPQLPPDRHVEALLLTDGALYVAGVFDDVFGPKTSGLRIFPVAAPELNYRHHLPLLQQ